MLLALAPFLSGLLGAAVFVRHFRQAVSASVACDEPGLAEAITVVVALIIIALPLTWLIGIVIDQAPDSLRAVRSNSLFARVGQLRIGSYDAGAEVAKASGTLVSWLSRQGFAFVGSATSAARAGQRTSTPSRCSSLLVKEQRATDTLLFGLLFH